MLHVACQERPPLVGSAAAAFGDGRRFSRRTRPGHGSLTWRPGSQPVGALVSDPTPLAGTHALRRHGRGNRCPRVRIRRRYRQDDERGNCCEAAWTLCHITPTRARTSGDAFLGRGSTRSSLIHHAKQIFVGSAMAVRGLSHVIRQRRPVEVEPGAIPPVGSTNRTDRRQHVHRGPGTATAGTFVSLNVGLDPQ